MRLLIVTVTLLALVHATKKSDFVTKIVNMGVKIPSKQQINQLCTCMETPVYQCRDMDNLTATGTDCGMNVMMSSLSNLYELYSSMDVCLKKCNTNSIALVTSLATAQMGSAVQGLNLFNTLMTNIKNWKAAKKTKAQVIENMYGWGAKQFNKSSVNTFCTNLVKSGSINKCEWNCTLTVGKKLVDFSAYKCATLKPST